jgi:hypothetical protein
VRRVDLGFPPPRLTCDSGGVGVYLFRSALGRAFLVVAPPDRTMQSVEVLDRAGKVLRRFKARIPPARRQCGYSFGAAAASARAVAVRPAAPPRAWQPYASDRAVRLTAGPWRRR